MEHPELSPGAGSFRLILGPMFSGKTTEMWRQIRRAAVAGRPSLVVVHAADTRYAARDGLPDAEGRRAVVASHDGSLAPPAGLPIRVVRAQALADVALRDDELFVGIDEGQFFADLADVGEAQWAGLLGRTVVVAALDGDFLRRPFPSVAAVLGRCESLVKLRGVCMRCRARDSSFTGRKPLVPCGITCPSAPQGTGRRVAVPDRAALALPSSSSDSGPAPSEADHRELRAAAVALPGSIAVGGLELYEALCRTCYAAWAPPAP